MGESEVINVDLIRFCGCVRCTIKSAFSDEDDEGGFLRAPES
jgi:hypothetical protein